MRIKNKEIRQRRHRKEKVIKAAERELRLKYEGKGGAKTAAPAEKPAPKAKAPAKKAEAAPKPKKAPAKKKETVAAEMPPEAPEAEITAEAANTADEGG